jgi:GTPase SAR1 family protein
MAVTQNLLQGQSDVRNLPKYKREDFLYRLKLFRQPLPDYLACFRMIEKAIKESYCPRNPFSIQTTHYLHHLDYENTEIVPDGGVISPEGTAMTLVGESGVGKTKMLEQVIKCFDQVIHHKKYQGLACPIAQVVWIKVTCPINASLSGLCRSILKEIDRALRRPLTKPSSRIEALIEQIEMEVRNHFIGVLIIDEMQNLKLQRTGGVENLINFIFNLIVRSGIPSLFCANPEFIETISYEFKTARRAESAGFISMRRMSKQVWDMFVPALWDLQITNTYTPLSEEMSNRLYSYSQGIIDVAVRIFEQMQRITLLNNDETMTPSLIDAAYEEACQLTNQGLSLLREANLAPTDAYKRKALYEKYKDLTANADYTFDVVPSKPSFLPPDNSPNSPNNNDGSIKESSLQLNTKTKKYREVLYDIHHPELENQYRYVLEHEVPDELIVDKDLVAQLLNEPSDPRYKTLFVEHIEIDELYGND